jgi:hypothetical protein
VNERFAHPVQLSHAADQGFTHFEKKDRRLNHPPTDNRIDEGPKFAISLFFHWINVVKNDP